MRTCLRSGEAICASLLSLFCAAILISPVARAQAGSPVEVQRLDGSKLAIQNFSEHRGTVLVFLSTRDQSAESAHESLQKLNAKVRRQKIMMVGVFPNPAESPSEVRDFCQASEFTFPCYRDPEHKAARQLGAKVTPEAFVFDSKGVLAAHSRLAELDSVLTNVVAGRPAGSTKLETAGSPIDKPKPARKIEPLDFISYSSELIFETIPGAPAHHASSMALAANGDLLVTWYGGSYESSDDEALFIARRPKGQRGWSTPEMLVRNPSQMVGNAVIFTLGNGDVCIIWGRMEASQPLLSHTGWDSTRLLYRVSKDNGKMWSADQKFPMDTAGWLPRNLAIHLADGTTVVPISDERNERDTSFVLITKDSGAHWTRSSVMPNSQSQGEQPAVTQRKDGSLLAFLRTKPRLLQTESTDGGASWSPAKATSLKNPDAAIGVCTLKDGTLVLVWNNSETSRSQLHIARSVDNGKTWGDPLLLESNPGEYSYPSIMQTPDGKIQIIYTYRRFSIKHVEINENWLVKMNRSN